MRQLPQTLVYVIDPTCIAVDLCCCIVAVSLSLRGDGELRNLLRWLVAPYILARTFDIQDERMVGRREVESRMAAVARTSTVEAREANIKSAGVVLKLCSARCSPDK